MKLRILAVAAVLALPLAGALPSVAADSIDAIVASPAQFDGKHVVVTGSAKDVKQKTSRKGNDYETFELCQTQCLSVWTWGHPSVASGASVTVSGTFAADKSVGSFHIKNEIDADEDGGITNGTSP